MRNLINSQEAAAQRAESGQEGVLKVVQRGREKLSTASTAARTAELLAELDRRFEAVLETACAAHGFPRPSPATILLVGELGKFVCERLASISPGVLRPDATR